MDKRASIYVAGHTGMAGSAIVRRLTSEGYNNLILRTSVELDLRNQHAVDDFFSRQRPAYVFLAAAEVGGILANSRRPADFIRNNLQIQTNVIDAAYRNGTAKLLFLGSSCIYPALAPQPIREEDLLTGPLESTNDAYAIAKIAGIRMVQAYAQQYEFKGISLMPTNLYGPGDNFHPEDSHVIAGLIRRIHEAKTAGAPEVSVWGTGAPRREFLHVDDFAAAALMLMNHYDRPEIVNVGTGQDITIRELVDLIVDTVGFNGTIRFDPTKPDGTPRKLLDVGRLTRLGWRPQISLKEGLRTAYEGYLRQPSRREVTSSAAR